jgi:hypothetical protein
MSSGTIRASRGRGWSARWLYQGQYERQDSRMSFSKGARQIPWPRRGSTPTGGVIMPRQRFMVITTPKRMGLYPTR